MNDKHIQRFENFNTKHTNMETGLQLTPSAKEDTRAIDKTIENSEFHVEYDSEFGFYFFPEEEENYDELEINIDNLLSGLDVNYRIEGVF